ncbi:hypothetical protein EKO04_005826 [Ascochyta lentis]|uniref:C2H2-type domain-containing protein n=1 Tax=Ascochyta lentis TaxID=205686 RepID=A0A8H7MDA6_9PLEO|nr:hypothetical protein EKO04_005826 [Ascochyta lentis]
MQTNDYDQTGPSIEAGDWGATSQGLQERVSTATFGTGGGAITSADPPYVASNLAATEASDVPSAQVNPYGWVDSHGRPYFSDKCIDPSLLTLTVADHDQPVYPENPSIYSGSGSLSQSNGVAEGSETHNVSWQPREQLSQSMAPVIPNLLIDQLMGDNPNPRPPVSILVELVDIPFSETQRLPTVPWSHPAAVEQAIPYGVYNDGVLLDRQNSRSTGETPLSDVGYAESTNTSWDPGANPTDPGMATSYLHPTSINQAAMPHTVDNRQQKFRCGSYSARSNISYTRGDTDVMFKHHNIVSSPGRIGRPASERQVASRHTKHRRNGVSPSPSVVSTTSSVTWTPMPCPVEDCRSQFTGQFGRGNLARHLRLVHNPREFPCEANGCHKVYNRQDALKKHRDQKHKP